MIFVVRLEFCVADLDVPKETLLDDIEVAPTMLMLSPYEYREFVIYIGPERIAALLTVDEPAIGRIEAPVDHGEIQRIIEYDRAEMDAKVSTFYEGNLAVHFPDQRPLKWRDEKTAESRLVHVPKRVRSEEHTSELQSLMRN